MNSEGPTFEFLKAMERKRRRAGGGVSALEVWLALRKVQRLTACTTTTLYTFLTVMDPFLVTGCTAAEIKHAEKELRGRSGATMIKLNGCVGPNCMHVFEPKDEDTRIRTVQFVVTLDMTMMVNRTKWGFTFL